MRLLIIILIVVISGCSTNKQADTMKVVVTGERVSRDSVDPVGSMTGAVFIGYIKVTQSQPTMSYILSDIGAPEPKRGDTKTNVLSQIEESGIQIVNKSQNSVAIISKSKATKLELQVVYNFENEMFKMYAITTSS